MVEPLGPRAARLGYGVRTLLWAAPGALVEEACHRGEVFVARLRVLLFVGMAVLFHVSNPYGDAPGPRAAVHGISAAIVLGAVVLLHAATRGWGPRRLPFVSAAFDVAIITASLLLTHALALPNAQMLELLLLPSYLLILIGAVLRYDPRVCIWVGGLALASYEAVGLALGHRLFVHRVLGGPRWDPAALGDPMAAMYGSFLLVGTVLCVTTVRHSLDLRMRATHDGLTGLANRSYFDQRLACEDRRARSLGRPYTVVMIDVDRFKAVNDRLGHPAGDAVLRALAEVIARHFRSTDLVGRHGGEEFAVIVPDSRPEAIRRRLEEIRASLTTLRLGRRVLPVTVSAGVACHPDDGRSYEEVLAAADRRLYAAKSGGRDRVVWPGEAPAAEAGAGRASA